MRGKAGLFSRFQPLDPKTLSGLTAWWDASDSATLYDATTGGALVSADGSVARIEDKSGNARHLTQSVSNGRPVRKTAIQNGLDVMRFDGTDDRLDTAVLMSTFISGSACSVFIVAKAAAVNTNSETQAFNDTVFSEASSGNGFVALRSNGTAASFGYKFDEKVASASYAAGDWKVFTTTHESSSLSLRINGGTASTVGGLSSREFLSNQARVGQNFNQSAFFDGDVGEILTYNVALSTANREAVEAYLLSKWGIS
jgi:hypothetical protein